MKTLSQTLNETTNPLAYRVEFNGTVGGDNLPISATIILDTRKDIKGFEKFLEDEQDNIFAHADGGSVEY